MPPSKRRNKGKHETAPVEVTAPATADVPKDSSNDDTKQPPPAAPKDQLVLTSGKRRGMYECDYCHADISQIPRIRCASCPDFDLCLDCFATTDHSAAIKRLKALGQVHDAVSSGKSGVSAAAANHDETHGYRVADSTRYPLFPAVRVIVPSRPSSVVPVDEEEAENKDEMDSTGDKGDKDKDDQTEQQDETGNEEKMKDGSKKDDEQKEEQTSVKPGDEVVDMDIDGDSKDAANQDASPQEEESTENKTTEKVQPGENVTVEDSKEDDVSDKAGKAMSEAASEVTVAADDPRSAWTVEEDLRLLTAIETCGMGNWADISEAIAGNGSSNKTPKRCMERYFDDFLGRYGHVLPPYTFVEEESDNEDSEASVTNDDTKSDTDLARGAKRRRTERNLFRSQSLMSLSSFRSRKTSKVVPTSSLPGYDDVWPDAYIPPLPNIKVGQEVGRDQSMRAENLFVKTLSNVVSREEADKLRKEWIQTRLNQINGPTVLPLRSDDVAAMPGAELAGYMPRRGDFDIEWDNDAETILADMEFSPNDLPQDRQLKIQVIEIYNSKLDERERRKQFLLSRNLTDYRKNQQADMRLPSDERDLVRRMRLFERFQSPEEHKQFIADLLKAKRLRKEIAKLQMYRRMGIKTLAEAEKFDLDKNRREYHKFAQLQKEEEVEKAKAAAARVAAAREIASIGAGPTGEASFSLSSSLWKQYKTSDRKGRRSINRTGSSTSNVSSLNNTELNPNAADDGNDNVDAAKPDDKPAGEGKPAEATKPDAPPAEAPPQTQGEASVKPAAAAFNIVRSRGYELLSSKEVALCERLHLLPSHYLEIKKALIQESLSRGLLDREGSGSSRRSIVKIDAEKRGDVIDFMVHAGWISTKGNAAASGIRSST